MSERIAGLVSVVVPIFNAERFLAEAIESVLAQTYSSWELLLVDDGSTDRSLQIARQYESQDRDRIRVLQHVEGRNLDLCATRNLGVRHSRGEFIALLDADDLWYPEKLERQLCVMRDHPEAALTYGPSEYFDDETKAEVRTFALADAGLYSAPDLLKKTSPLGSSGAPCPSSFFMRYDLLSEVGGFEEAFTRPSLYEDTAFLAKVYLRRPVYVTASGWSKYRCHKDSCCARTVQRGEELRTRERYLRWLQDLLQREKVTDPEIWNAVRRLDLPFRHPRMAWVVRFFKQMIRALARPTRAALDTDNLTMRVPGGHGHSTRQ